MTIHFYGITNCDTVKKARTWGDFSTSLASSSRAAERLRGNPLPVMDCFASLAMTS
jgi:hypothetical protein